MNIRFRMASVSDAESLLNIYAPYVTDTCISFEDTVPSVTEFGSRIQDITRNFPYIVCELNGEPVGYAYAHSYRARAAYNWGAELSIYVDKNTHHRRIGTALYTALISLLKEMNYQTVYGIVTYPNPKSEKLHEKMGFSNCGILKKCGYKLGQWVDIVNYELEIGTFPAEPPKLLTVNDIPPEKTAFVFSKAIAKIHI